MHSYGTKPQSSIRDGRFKLIRFWESGEVKLFDLEADIGELRDRAPEMPDRAGEMEQRLLHYLEAVGAQMAHPNPEYDPATDPQPRYPGS
jgi:uncharacterized sulfatase